MSINGLPNWHSDALAAQCTAELPRAITELLALAFFFCLLRAFGSACSLTISIKGKIRVEVKFLHKSNREKEAKKTFSL